MNKHSILCGYNREGCWLRQILSMVWSHSSRDQQKLVQLDLQCSFPKLRRWLGLLELLDSVMEFIEEMELLLVQ